MKRLSGLISNDESYIDITPMLDVVFIMLIFFIVTASFVREQGIGLYSPPVQEPTEVTTAPIIVSVTETDEILIQNRLVNGSAVKPTILRLRAENPQSAVVLKVAHQAKTKAMIRALDGIRAANVQLPSVSLST
ncbi:MAG: biopolymer transporter ExbD [Pseudomonadota bacterium]